MSNKIEVYANMTYDITLKEKKRKLIFKKESYNQDKVGHQVSPFSVLSIRTVLV